MRVIETDHGDWHFPENPEEAREWIATIRIHSLASRVLAVATTRIEGAWKAYIDTVPGYNHCHEFQEVLDHGAALEEEIATILFPRFNGLPYSH